MDLWSGSQMLTMLSTINLPIFLRIMIVNYKWLKWSLKVAQSCPTLCDPMDYTVHGILQARILEWVAFPFSRGSSQPRDRTQVSHIAGGFFTSWITREAHKWLSVHKFGGCIEIKSIHKLCVSEWDEHPRLSELKKWIAIDLHRCAKAATY